MCEFWGVGAEASMLGTVDITLRVMHHTECDVYDQNQTPRTKRPCLFGCFCLYFSIPARDSCSRHPPPEVKREEKPTTQSVRMTPLLPHSPVQLPHAGPAFAVQTESVTKATVIGVEGGQSYEKVDDLAVEEPLAIA